MDVSPRTLPRVVTVTRPTAWETMVERAGTAGHARFLLESGGRDPEVLVAAHARQAAAVGLVHAAIQPGRRQVHVRREVLDRFVFEPDDIVIAVGQDGLVPNVAKYLSGQMVAGINPDPGQYDGVLCRMDAALTASLLAWCDGRRMRERGRGMHGSPGPERGEPLGFRIQPRTMAMARREDGMVLRALNEIFCGHTSHQSARYIISVNGTSERQSSSGVICATGTGCTGWARSILRQRSNAADPVLPESRELLWLSREPFPSVSTGVSLEQGVLDSGAELRLHSEMGSGGVVFADGMEADFLPFLEGQSVAIGVDPTPLNLVVPVLEQQG